MAHEKTILLDTFIEHHTAAYADDPELSVIFGAMTNADLTIADPVYTAVGATATINAAGVSLTAPDQTYVKADVETSADAWTLVSPTALTASAQIADQTESGMYLLTEGSETKVIMVVMTTSATDVATEVQALMASKLKYTVDVLPTITASRVGWTPESALHSLTGEVTFHEVAKELVIPATDLGQLEVPPAV